MTSRTAAFLHKCLKCILATNTHSKPAIIASLKPFWNLDATTGTIKLFLYSAGTHRIRSTSLLSWAIPNTFLTSRIVFVRQWENLELSGCLALVIIAPRTLLETTFAKRADEVCASLYKKPSRWTEGDFKTPPEQEPEHLECRFV